MNNESNKQFGHKVFPGMAYAFDPYNKGGAKETSIMHVITIKKVKNKMFGNSLWEVRDLDSENSKSFIVKESSLYPKNISLVRFPDDLPSFNDKDIGALEGAIEILETLTVAKDDTKRLKALKAKIELCLKMREL